MGALRMAKATALLAVLALCASAALFLAGSSSMRRLELEGSYVKLGDNNGFGTNAAFIDKGNLPEGMHDNTRGALLWMARCRRWHLRAGTSQFPVRWAPRRCLHSKGP